MANFYKKVNECASWIKVGMLVECDGDCAGVAVGGVYTGRVVYTGSSSFSINRHDRGCNWQVYFDNPKASIREIRTESSIKTEGTMKKVITDVFEKTADAVLVEKHFDKEITDNFISGLTIKQHKEAIIAEATRREEIENSNKDK